MVSDASYGWEIHYKAILALMEGSGSPEERLVSALIELVMLRHGNLHEVPDHFRGEFEAFVDEMTSVPATGGKGAVQATVATLNVFEVQTAMEKILSFYTSIVEYRERSSLKDEELS